MNINLVLGEIYDTIRFFEIYFNYDEIIKDLRDRNYDIEGALKCYNEVNKNIEISPHLHAFFDLNKNEKSLLTSLFISQIEKIKTINDYLILLKNKNLIIDNLIDYYCEVLTLHEKEKIRKDYTGNNVLQQIYDLKINSKSKVSLAFIFDNYEKYINLLISAIVDISNNMVLLYKNKYTSILGFSLKESYLSKLRDIAKIDNFENAEYCISLLHSYSYKIINNKYLILGNMYEEVLDKQYLFLNVTISSFCDIFSNELNILIIDIIYKQKKIHTAGIIKLLPPGYSTATVYRLIGNLTDEKILKIVDNTNKEIYYSLNTDYFENARNINFDSKNQLNKKLDDFVSIINNYYMNEILNIINLNSNISGYEIVKRLDSSSYSSSSIYRFIKILYLNNLIYISEQKYRYKYYSINRNYFKELKKTMNEYIKYYENENLILNELEKYLAIYF